MKKRYRIDAAQLRAHRACAYDSNRFNRAFPNGMEINQDDVRKAIEHQLPLRWAAQRLCRAGYHVNDSRVIAKGERLYNALNDAEDSQRTAVRAHRLMQELAEEWEKFKVKYPAALPANY